MFEGLQFDSAPVDQRKHVFAAQLVPFRSKSWAKLYDHEAALTKSLELWRWVLEQSPARLYLTLGKRPGREIAKLLGAKEEERHEVGWGRQFIEEFVAPDGRTVLAIPHLSRFRLFTTGRPQAGEVLRQVAARVSAY